MLLSIRDYSCLRLSPDDRAVVAVLIQGGKSGTLDQHLGPIHGRIQQVARAFRSTGYDARSRYSPYARTTLTN